MWYTHENTGVILITWAASMRSFLIYLSYITCVYCVCCTNMYDFHKKIKNKNVCTIMAAMNTMKQWQLYRLPTSPRQRVDNDKSKHRPNGETSASDLSVHLYRLRPNRTWSQFYVLCIYNLNKALQQSSFM